MRTVAIMQPYFMPYIGYFHLLQAVDIFVIYDDIQYTKKGWINRNRLLFEEKIQHVTLPLVRDSDYLSVFQRVISTEWNIKSKKYIRKLQKNYRKRKNFDRGMELCKEIFDHKDLNLFNFIFNSLLIICNEMKINTEIIKSSTLGDFSYLKGKEKVKKICKSLNAGRYINPIGGITLYDKQDFQESGIDLKLVSSRLTPYEQMVKQFMPGLSVIDMIFSINEFSEIKKHLNNYELL